MAEFACLFDMDGLLLDTERVGLRVFERLAAAQGMAPEAASAFYLGLIGNTVAATLRAFEETFPRIDPMQMHQDWLDGMDADMAAGIPLRPTVREALAHLEEQGTRCAVVTSTAGDRARYKLARAGLDGHFDIVIGGDEVARGKPDPAPYLAGAAALGLAPEACFAFEDSDTGTRAAVAAGCNTWQIPDLRPPGPLQQLGQSVADSLREAVISAGLLAAGE